MPESGARMPESGADYSMNISIIMGEGKMAPSYLAGSSKVENGGFQGGGKLGRTFSS